MVRLVTRCLDAPGHPALPHLSQLLAATTRSTRGSVLAPHIGDTDVEHASRTSTTVFTVFPNPQATVQVKSPPFPAAVSPFVSSQEEKVSGNFFIVHQFVVRGRATIHIITSATQNKNKHHHYEQVTCVSIYRRFFSIRHRRRSSPTLVPWNRVTTLPQDV